MDLNKYMSQKREVINKELARHLPSEKTHPKDLHNAMRYTVLAEGKRLRPILVLAVADMYGVDNKKVMPLACAVEMVHAASLIFDDLPIADDAKMRRGKQTLHEKFNQLVAVHSALGLCAKVGEVALDAEVDDVNKTREAVKILVKAVGTEGLIGGQFVDIITTGRKPKKDIVKFIYYNKTAKLFMAAVEASAVLCGAPEKERKALVEYAKNLGIAFQIRDDLLDAEGEKEKVGKDLGKDNKKLTVISLAGINYSKELMNKYFDKARGALSKFHSVEILKDIAVDLEDY